ncbi:MAG: FG-GAP-like repeat-containing protein [Calditrichia bacterium]
MSVSFRIFILTGLLLPGILKYDALGQSGPLQRMFSPDSGHHLLPEFSDSYGVVFRDLNNDGLPDIYVVRFRNLNRLFINRGPGIPFADATIQSGLGGNLMPRGQQNLELGAAAGDYNNDGWPDMLIAGWGESLRLFRQRPKLRFTDATGRAMLNSPTDANGGFWADVNLDGALDLFITDEHHPNQLYLGNGRGDFVNKTSQWRLSGDAVSQGAAFSDVDGDGYPDLYVCNWFGPDVFYRNINGGKFQQVRLDLPHLTASYYSNGATFGDVDNDGDPDLLVTDRQGYSCLYRNDCITGDTLWRFSDITDTSGLRIPYPAYGTVMADLNHDSWLDIWVNTIGPNLLFLNTGGGNFRLAYKDSLSSHRPGTYYSTGAAAADVDLDGDVDLFVANKDTHSVLYLNPLNDRNFIQFELMGVTSNRDAIGAKVWLYRQTENGIPGRLAGFREISGGAGYLSQNSLKAHFGVDPAFIYTARVVFPGGENLLLKDLAPGTFHKVAEHGLLLRAAWRSWKFIIKLISERGFWLDFFLFLLVFALLVGYTMYGMNRYRWSNRQVVLFLLITLLLLYGIFLGMSSLSLRQRFLLQLGILSGFLLLLTFFMEKIRRLELRRWEYRRLLRDFSSELIFIKDNRELFNRLVQRIYHSVHPRYCTIYLNEEGRLKRLESLGDYSPPEEVKLPGNFSGNDPDAVVPLLNLPEPVRLFPLRRGRQVFGFLVIGPAAGKNSFDEADAATFRSLSDQAAIAVENNLYIEESRRLIQQITESETREKYLAELEKAYATLEDKNKRLEQLFTDLKETQAQLVQSEKMASLGQLMAGIAHELNNPISYIYANLKELDRYGEVMQRFLQKELDREAADDADNRELKELLQDLKQMIEDSLQGSMRVKDLVQNLRNFSRVDETGLKPVDLHKGLESTLRLLNNEIKNRIVIRKEYGELPPLWCNPGQINQVFMNILMNGIQAIEKDGLILITTRVLNENEVEIAVCDSGSGIPPEVKSRIFDPFFTTKPVGKGTGLGLSISYHIIQKHGGKLLVESQPGNGTEFRIILPVQPKQQKDEQSESPLKSNKKQENV